MFLKNNSNFKIGFKTKKETLSVLPNDCIKVFEKDIIKLSAKLIEITEEEYKEWLNSKVEKTKSTDAVDNQPVVNEDETQSTGIEKTEVKTDETEKDVTTDETQSAETEKSEVKTDETQPTEQIVEDEEIATLHNKLEELKNAWEQSSRPNKKAAIQKQIVEVKEQLEKLTENK